VTVDGSNADFVVSVGEEVLLFNVDGTNEWAINSGVVGPEAEATVTGTTDQLADADHGKVIVYNNAAAVTVTLPTDATDDLADGFECMLVSAGAGGLSLGTSGITLIGSSPSTGVAQNEALYVKKTATANTWIVLGGTV
jgi:hypothetical protein